MNIAVSKSLSEKKRANLAAARKAWKAGTSGASHYPLVFYLEPTSICNLNCPMCPVAMGVEEYQYPEQIISLDLIEKLREPLEYGLRCLLSGGGEPLMHPQFVDIIDLVKKLEMEIIFNTNATLVDEEFAKYVVERGVDCISVSIDAIDPGIYRSIRRGGEFEQVVKGLRLIRQARDKRGAQKPYLNMQFTLMKENLGELQSLVEFAAAQSINHLVAEPLSPIFSFDMSYQGFFKEHYLPKSQELVNLLRGLEREAKSAGIFFSSHYFEERRYPERCAQPWINFGVRTSGRAFLCCGTTERMGSLTEQSFGQIWNGEIYQGFRTAIASGKYPEPCRLCLQEARSPWFNHELLERE